MAARALDYDTETAFASAEGEVEETRGLTQELLETATYSRQGSDLVLVGEDGHALTVPGYFSGGTPADLHADSGAFLSGETVSLLAGPGPVRTAQATTNDAGSSSAEEIGQVETLTGTASVQRTDGSTVELKIGMPVYQGDVVMTGSDGKLGLSFNDKSVFSLSSNGTMVLNEMVYDPDSSSSNKMLFSLVKGSLGFATGGVAPTGGVTIDTPVAAMAIRGTRPIFLDLGNGKYVFMSEEGQFEVVSKLPGGESITVSASSGQALYFADGLSTPPVPVPLAGSGYEDKAEELIQQLGQSIKEALERRADSNTGSPDFTEGGSFESLESADIINELSKLLAPLLEATVLAEAEPEALEELSTSNVAPTVNLGGPVPGVGIDEVFTETDGEQVLQGSGIINFDDLNEPDVVDISSDYNGDLVGPPGVTLPDGLAETLIEGFRTVDLIDSEAPGTTGWVYETTANLDFLAAGETITFSYTVTATDNEGATGTDVVTITITGTNDQPTVSASAASGFTETDGVQTLEDSGTINFDDIDQSDVVDISSAYNDDLVGSSGVTLPAGLAVTLIAGFSTANVTNAAAPGSTAWSYNASANLDFLAAGETITFSYTVTATDDEGATATDVVTITITGTNDQPTLTIEDTSGDVDEGDGTAVLSDSGTLSFGDLDVTDVVTVSQTSNDDIVWSGGTLDSTLAAALVEGFSVDQDSWDYETNENLDFLGEGETITFSYTVVATDDSGAENDTSEPKTVTITITGTNDQPTLTIEDTSGDVDEGDGTAVLSDSGTLSFGDLDVTDVVTVSQTSNDDIVWSGGTLDSTLAAALVEGFSVDQDSWDYETNENLDFLGEGETITFSYTVVATDDSGAENDTSEPKTVTITITGTNDQPTLTIEDTSGDVDEGDGTAVLSDSGTLSFGDLDVTDVVTVSQTSNDDIVWSGGTLDSTLAAALVEGFSVDQDSWDYETNENLDFLGEGETITFSYTVVATDDSGAENDTSEPKTVTITITGTNDQPTLTIEDTSGDVDEGDGTAVLSDSGTLSFGDLDVTDVVTVSQTSNDDIVWSGGTLDSTLAAALVEGFSVDQDSWDYETNENLDFLGEGETITFSYTVVATDDSGAENDTSEPKTVTITITGTNDQPTLATVSGATLNDTAGEDTFADVTGTLSGSDRDSGDTVSFELADGSESEEGGFDVEKSSAYGTFYLNTETGAYKFVADDDAIEGLKTTETVDFVVNATDGTADSAAQTITITINGDNDAPILATVSGATLNDTAGEDTFADVTGTLSGSDRDSGDTVSFELADGSESEEGGFDVEKSSAYGTFYLNTETGAYKFVADDDAIEGLKTTETVDFVVNATDGTADSAAQTITITINGDNDAPILATVSGATLNDTAGEDTFADVTGTLSGSDRDSGDTVSFELADGSESEEGGFDVEKSSAYGTFYLNTETGAYKFVADDDAIEGLKTTETVDFVVNATDGTADSAAQTITITINGDNDAPIVRSSNVIVPSDPTGSLLSYPIHLIMPTDADGDALTFKFEDATQAANVYFLVGDNIQPLTPGEPYPISMLSSLVYQPTSVIDDEFTTTLTFLVSDSDFLIGEPQSFEVTISEYVIDPPGIVSTIIAPVNFGKNGTGSVILNESLSVALSTEPTSGQIELTTDFGPKGNDDSPPLTSVDDELTVYIVVDDIQFIVAGADQPDAWEIDEVTGLKVLTISFDEAVATGEDGPIMGEDGPLTLAEYLSTSGNAPLENDQWQVIAIDSEQGPNQARFVQVEISSTNLDGGSQPLLLGDTDVPNVIYGSNQSDQIVGGDMDDILLGGAGANSIIGGEGIDLFVIDPSALTEVNMADIIADYNYIDGDTVDLSALFGVGSTEDVSEFVRVVGKRGWKCGRPAGQF